MSTRLIVFLGKPPRGNYDTVSYQFDERRGDGVSFFGVALYRHLRAAHVNIDELMILGTPGSIWHRVFELRELESERDLELAAGLEASVTAGTVGNDELEELEDRLADELGVTVACCLIGEADRRDGQMDLFELLSAGVRLGDDLYVDVTHGFRHWGLFTLQTLQFLKLARGVRLRGVYYGMRDGRAVELAVDEVAEWSQQLAMFRRTGLLGGFRPLLERYDAGLGEAVGDLNHAMITHQLHDLPGLVRRVRSMLREPGRLDDEPLMKVFARALRDELDVFVDSPHMADWQLELAERALGSGDYLRCSLLLCEALVSAAIGDERRRGSRRLRERAAGELKGRVFTQFDVKQLYAIRNAMAHGSEPGGLATELENAGRYFRNMLKRVGSEVDRLHEHPIL